MTYRTLIILLITLLLSHGYVIAADLEAPKNRGPVEVSSDKMVADDLAKTLVFEGNAGATQDDVTIYADRLTVTYTGEEREIQQVVAEDSVRIVQGARVATGDKAVLYHAEERIVLTGTPEVKDGENFVKGDEITLYLNDQRSVVTGGDGGRVNAVFTPKTEE
jgi:lipopolysaccharide export system protein LptA